MVYKVVVSSVSYIVTTTTSCDVGGLVGLEVASLCRVDVDYCFYVIGCWLCSFLSRVCVWAGRLGLLWIV